jgi:hypothetical protein
MTVFISRLTKISIFLELGRIDPAGALAPDLEIFAQSINDKFLSICALIFKFVPKQII